VILSWTASTTPGVLGYDVYRGTTSGGESSTPLNSSPINGATFTDSNVTAGQAYYYVIMAVNSSDALSGCSNEASVAVP
jgi:fibronectin type 3 domain-containing protein